MLKRNQIQLLSLTGEIRRGINYDVQISFCVSCLVEASIAFTVSKVSVPGDSVVSAGVNKEEPYVICKWQGSAKLLHLLAVTFSI